MSVKVKFINQVKVKNEKTVLKAAKEAKLSIKSPCGGKGTCGKCIVKIVEGKVSEPTKAEIKLLGQQKIDEGYRLACEAVVVEDVSIKIVKA
jgi:ferredoxin